MAPPLVEIIHCGKPDYNYPSHSLLTLPVADGDLDNLVEEINRCQAEIGNEHSDL
jgi:hypothetical protein